MTTIASPASLRTTASPRLLTITMRCAAYASGLLAGALVAVATLPPLGAVMTICIAISLIRSHPSRLLVVALACGIAGMLITVLLHFPLNATIMAWPAGVIPSDFAAIATRWLAAHLVRTVLTVTSFVLVVIALARVARSS